MSDCVICLTVTSEDVPVVTYQTYETSTLKILGSRSLTLFRNRLRIYMNIDTIVIVSNDVQIMFYSSF